jgi:predicted dehydrogenase
LFGPVVKVSCAAGRIGALDIDVEDYAAIVLEHQSGTRSEVHLDYLQRFKRRGCEVVGAEGTLVWESEGKSPEQCTVRVVRAGAPAWERLLTVEAVDTAKQLADVSVQFAAAIAGKQTDLLGGRDALEVLQTALAAHRAAATGTSVALVKQ